MTWPKPDMNNGVTLPKKLHFARWVLFFSIFTLITGIVFFLIWKEEDNISQWLFVTKGVLIPFVLCSIALSVRIYIYGLALEKYEIWHDEVAHINQNWQLWAMQSLMVMDSYCVLPKPLTTKKILYDSSNLPVEMDKTLAFDDTFELKQHVEHILCSVSGLLSQLSKTESINITIYSSPEAYGSYLNSEIDDAYKAARIEQAYTLSHHIMHHANAEILTEWIDNEQSALQLIIINNTISSISTAFLCTLLLMDKTRYQKLALDIAKGEILRPMITTDMVKGIKQMVEIQPAMQKVEQFWFANLDKKQEGRLSVSLAKSNFSLEEIYKLDIIVGKQTQLAYWLALALGCEMISQTEQNNFIAAISQNQWIFTVLTAVNKK
ncbi:MAG: hypothetical protein J6562_03925 [Candidatus Schmidhempelia sp.]|nr:hypothetical protein [Candidatus Schmidhempelia sp.]